MKKLNLFTELCGIILGAGIYGLAVTGINIPSKLADGGVTGIALLLHNLFGFFHFIDYCIYYKKRGFVINCHASFTYEIFSRVKVFLVEHNK
ncbi:hypothetical protein EfmAA96_11690 [Enterococcus faecium]|nr:hypothetical protein EfmAA96_11690 [Enterococcus faecium]